MKGKKAYPVAMVARAAAQAASLLGMLLATGAIDTHTFGIFSVAWVSAVVARTVVYRGAYEVMLRIEGLEEAQHAFFWSQITEGGLYSLLMVGAGVYLNGTGRAEMGYGLTVLAMIPVLAAANAWYEAVLVRRGRNALVAVLFFVSEGLGVALLTYLLRVAEGLDALLFWRAAGTATGLALLVIAAGTRPRLSGLGAARARVKETWALKGTTLASLLAAYGGDFLLALHIGPAASGAYRLAARVSGTGADVFLQPLRPFVWREMGAAERSGELEALRKVVLQRLRLVVMCAWPSLTLVAIFGRDLLAAFARPEWQQAAGLLTIFALARMPAVLDYFLEPVLVCTGQARGSFWFSNVCLGVLLIGIVCTSPYGAGAVAWWHLTYAILSGSVAWSLVHRRLRLDFGRAFAAVLPGIGVTLACVCGAQVLFRSLPFSMPIRLVTSLGGAGVIGALALFASFQRPESVTRS